MFFRKALWDGITAASILLLSTLLVTTVGGLKTGMLFSAVMAIIVAIYAASITIKNLKHYRNSDPAVAKISKADCVVLTLQTIILVGIAGVALYVTHLM